MHYSIYTCLKNVKMFAEMNLFDLLKDMLICSFDYDTKWKIKLICRTMEIEHYIIQTC